ncbi:hypothetical protein [Paenibacillus ginsengihumi]|uniref:hypothetical protein n=1 Tax=Paenibacillus ginsengihumi TaxID=431596 RepID=UPI0003829EE0|nr:hypothetical protein [Paenibacillus ginsengihumi]
MTVAAFLGVIASAAIIAAIELPVMLRNRLKKEMVVFTLALLAGTALCGARALRFALPNPLELLVVVYTPVYEWYKSLLS